jgi:hypothetical protein
VQSLGFEVCAREFGDEPRQKTELDELSGCHAVAEFIEDIVRPADTTTIKPVGGGRESYYPRAWVSGDKGAILPLAFKWDPMCLINDEKVERLE